LTYLFILLLVRLPSMTIKYRSDPSVDFISTHLRAELDFIAEASNAQRTASLIASEPRLVGKVHIPKVYPEYSTKRVLTAEWIDGVRLSDREALGRVVGEELLEKSGGMFADTAHEKKNGIPESMYHVKLKGGMRAIMHTMVRISAYL
jgi:aarF domain-containing kinase